MEPKIFCSALVSLCWLHYDNPKFITSLFKKLSASEKLTKLKPTDIIAVLQSISAKAKYNKIPKDVTEAYLNRIVDPIMLPATSCSDVSMLFHCSEKMNIRDTNRINILLNELLKREDLVSQMEVKDIYMILGHLKDTSLAQDDRITEILKPLKIKEINNANVYYLARVVMCLCEMGKSYRKVTDGIVKEMLKGPHRNEININDLKNLYQALKKADFEYGEVGALYKERIRKIKNQLIKNEEVDLDEEEEEEGTTGDEDFGDDEALDSEML